jgi:hypothetical protein
MKEYYERKLKEYIKLYSEKMKECEELKKTIRIVFYCNLATIIILIIVILNIIK